VSNATPLLSESDMESTTIARASTTDRQRTLFGLALVLPYLIGTLWTLGHPIVSVMTGESKCRGWYIDEHSLDSSFFRSRDKYMTVESSTSKRSGINSLCRALESVECHSHGGVIEVARIVPLEGAIEPVSESIVLLIPPCDDWSTSDFHFAITQLAKRLSSAAWLAKTVLIVAPADVLISMEDTMERFINAYLGSTVNETATMLPPQLTSAMIRSLLVVNTETNPVDAPNQNTLKILPQGRRGVLPNMDLIFHVMTIYASASFMDTRRYPFTMFMHPYTDTSMQWRNFVSTFLPKKLHTWATEVADMLLFAYTLSMGPYPVHAPVLDRGVDSLTLELTLSGKNPGSQGPFLVEFVQQLEHVIHGLSNLHERLHHSLTQYILPSPSKFVSHSEYIIPNFLLLVPLVVKVFMLILLEIKVFDFSAFAKAFMALMFGVALLVVSSSLNLPQSNGLCFLGYMILPLNFKRGQQKHKFATKSLQLMTCLLAIYSHIPLVLGHVSLAYPSALLWTPLILCLNHERYFQRLLGAAVLLITWPPLLLVPYPFEVYTPYLCLVYIPLHLLVAMQWLSAF